MDNNTTATRLARTLSVVLHPFFMPIYLLSVFLFFTNTAFATFSPQFKFYLLWVVALYTLVIPFLTLCLLRSLGRVSSLRVDERGERILPLAIGALCYVLCAITIGRIPSVELLRRLMLAAACCEIFCLAVSHFWKISLHLTALGGCVAIITVLAVAGIDSLVPWLVAALLAAGALGSARLYLGKHDGAQIAAGFFGGFVVAAMALMLL